MNNEIQQIAQQNDMNIEFVHWFFNEKKAACGEQWFLALGAMWEGWKAREGEATALALTFEKSREASGCPAGVDLQDWVKQLAAENKRLNDVAQGGAFVMQKALMKYEFGVGMTMQAEDFIRDAREKHPATDRIVAEAEARGVEKFAESQKEYVRQHRNEIDQVLCAAYVGSAVDAERFAKKLRDGGK